MITVILADSSARVIQKVSLEGNEKALFRSDLKLLGELDSYSYSTFSAEDMDQIIGELSLAKESLSDLLMKNHISEIIKLALICKNKDASTITFTPFGDIS